MIKMEISCEWHGQKNYEKQAVICHRSEKYQQIWELNLMRSETAVLWKGFTIYERQALSLLEFCYWFGGLKKKLLWLSTADDSAIFMFS